MTISKTDLRALVRAREADLTEETRRAGDAKLISRFLASPEYRAAGTVLLYFGVGGEPDTRPILTDALRAGKRVALPRIAGPGVLEAREIRDLSELVPGKFHIPEPGEGCPLLPPEMFDLILVPGAAFTREGGRLGRGGGYYDRYLPRTRGKKLALARPEQLFDALPVEGHDVPVDLVITGEDLEVVSFYDSPRQAHWLEEIKRSDWGAGAFLYELLRDGTFFRAVGEGSRVLLLTRGEELISFCTYAKWDDIQPTELTPWMGFVYTFPRHRGHRYVGLLFEEIRRLARDEHVSEVYISTDHTGLYEKYGCEYMTQLPDRDGCPSRIYVKRIAPRAPGEP